ncbi:translation initiation factor IF-1, putative [Plasmodium ovale]|uniref:Translation initiation factor IF-1, putative n=1 Tax=Plasmodium ovale TaxID=36330 RepID=A0A1D3TKW4_PLAOA|nr:translation initiation factor IF-1, putative [Plasmodium ovale]
MYDKIYFFYFFFCTSFLLYVTNEVNIKDTFFMNNVVGMYITGGACPTSNRKNNLFKKYRCIYNNSRNNLVREKDMDTIEMNGIIDECLANTNFVVRIPNGEKFLCFISGKLRINKVKINLGDTVKIQIHKLNFEKRRGKIIFRYLQQAAPKGRR